MAAALSFSLAACGQNAALSESVSAAISESEAESSAESTAESRIVSQPTAAPSPTPAPTQKPTATPEPTAAPTPTPVSETQTSQPEQPQQAEPQPEEAAPAENVAPAPSAGHGYWTIFGDGAARDAINNLRVSLGLGTLEWNSELGDVAAARCEQIMADFSHNGMTAPENLAMGTPDAASTVAAWQGSSAHYANMTNPNYTQVAIAHAYDGDGCHYWCATFG